MPCPPYPRRLLRSRRPLVPLAEMRLASFFVRGSTGLFIGVTVYYVVLRYSGLLIFVLLETRKSLSSDFREM